MKTRSVLAASLLAALSSPVMAQVWLPAEGIWQIDGANGSGLTLDVRDTAIGIGLYTYDEEGVATWYSGAGAISDDGVLESSLTQFEDGDGDTPTAVGTLDIRLELAGSAKGALAIGDADAVQVRHFAFGADYIGGVQLGMMWDVTTVPDMRGRWVIAPTGPDLPETMDLEFRSFVTNERSVSFSTAAEFGVDETGTVYYFSCSPWPNLDGPPDRCHLSTTTEPPQPPMFPGTLGYFVPEDLSATRIAGAQSDLIAFRVPTGINIPQSGIWQIAGRFGEGVTLDVRDNFAAIGVYGYDAEGNATWSLATGPLENTTDGHSMEGDLLTFTGGSCLGCDHTAPTVDETRPVRVDFIGATRARITIGDGEPMALSLLPFGAAYLEKPLAGDPHAEEFGQHALPALTGAWSQVAVNGTTPVGAPTPYPATTWTYGEVETASLDGSTYNLLLAEPATRWDPLSGIAGSTRASVIGCEVGVGSDVPECHLINPGGGGSPPAPPRVIADIDPWNISANRISGVSTLNGGTQEPVYLFRVPTSAAQTPSD